MKRDMIALPITYSHITSGIFCLSRTTWYIHVNDISIIQIVNKFIRISSLYPTCQGLCRGNVSLEISDHSTPRIRAIRSPWRKLVGSPKRDLLHRIQVNFPGPSTEISASVSSLLSGRPSCHQPPHQRRPFLLVYCLLFTLFTSSLPFILTPSPC